MSGRRRPILRIYRALLALYPSTFRASYRADACRTFEEALSQTGGVRRWALGLWFVFDAVLTLTAAWIRVSVDGLRGFGRALVYDTSSSLRSMRRSPGLITVVALTLALGIGANATMFGVVDRLLLRPPDHVRDHEGVRRVLVQRLTSAGALFTGSQISYPDYLDLERHSGFTALAAHRPLVVTRSVDGAAQRIRATLVTSSFLPLLGVELAMGRGFDASEDRIQAPGTAVLGHEYWQRAFGGDPGVLGQSLTLNGVRFTVIGVAPRGFTGVGLSAVDVWLPMLAAQSAFTSWQGWPSSRGWYWLNAVVRVAADVTLEAAEAEATVLHRNGRSEQIEQGRYDPEARIVMESLIVARSAQASDESLVAKWLAGVSTIVLLIACVNVANLLLARSVRRRRETALRLALGISRSRLIGQMVASSVGLALLGGAGAFLLAHWGGSVLQKILLPDVLWSVAGAGPRVALFTALASLLAGALAGLAPALQSTRVNLTADLASAGGRASARPSRVRSVLTVMQTAMSVVLLVGAGLFVRSLHEIRHLDLGFDTESLLIAAIEFDRDDIASEERSRLYEQAAARVARLPGVDRVAWTNAPFQSMYESSLWVPGVDSIPVLPGGGPYYYYVTPEYFSTVGLRIIRGRALQASDNRAAPLVAVVNQTMVRHLWPNADPIGRCFRVGTAESECRTVVGVTEDASTGALLYQEAMQYYLPIEQRSAPPRVAGLYVRVSEKAEEMIGAVAEAVQSSSPRVRYPGVGAMSKRLDPQARSWTLGATMFTVFGILALTVAGVGLYSLLAFGVIQRSKEIGIRSALGASRTTVVSSIVLEGVRLSLVGIGIGGAVTLTFGPALQEMLFRVSPTDPMVYAGVVTILLTVAVVASIVPAFRALGVDARVALQSD